MINNLDYDLPQYHTEETTSKKFLTVRNNFHVRCPK